MRVAQVVCTDAFAGVERYVATLSNGLACLGDEVTILGGDPERMEQAVVDAGVRWVHAPKVGVAIARLRRAGPFDVVHAHMTAAELAVVVADRLPMRRPRPHLIVTRHFARQRGSSAPARAVGHMLTRRLAAQLAISQYVSDRVEGASFVVPPGTPDVPATVLAASRQPMVLVAQRLEREKRTEDALEAWAISGLGGQGWRLVVAGDGSQRLHLEAVAARLGVASSCDFIGQRADLGDLYKEASVLLAPCPIEAFGLSVVEAMAAGLPVVATAGGGHDETVGACPGGALYPPGDLRRAGRLLADLAHHPARRDRYAEALRTIHHERFTVGRFVGETRQVYQSL